MHQTIFPEGLIGIAPFTLTIEVAFLAALAGLALGVLRWRRRTGRILFFASAVIMLLFAVAILLVLITVGSGSMG